METSQKNISSFKSELSDFLFERDLLQLILAVYLGTVLQDFFNSFVNGMILPLLLIFVPNAKVDNFEDIQIKFLGKNLAVGAVVFKFINLFIGFFISYIFVTHFLYRYLK
jgi:large-conductance mechanosensitive channel